MKRALVTGSAGFLGRHFVAELRRRGWHVSVIDVAYGRMDHPLGTTCLGYDALSLFSRAWIPSFDLVVHAAASSPHREAIDNEPAHMVRNLHLDAAMFGWAIRTGQRRMLYLSSSAAYPVRFQSREWVDGWKNRNQLPALDEDLINLTQWGKTGDWTPDASYGWVKLTGEMMAEQARKAGLPVTVVRVFSGYGEDQSENFPFRALIERARRRENPYVIWGDGTQVRDWIHVDDVVAGALAVVESETTDPVNICTGQGVDMLTLAASALNVVGDFPEIELRLDKPAGVAYRVGDPTRLHRYYKPQISLDEGIQRALRG